MSREIKFRTWQNDKMYFHELENYLGGSGIYNQFVGCDKAIWMQFTGLKDKNGLEIYEGDILKWVAKNEGKKGQIFNNVVYFLEYRYRIKGTNNGKTFHCDLTSNQIFNHECEVIGNIHQNPELG